MAMQKRCKTFRKRENTERFSKTEKRDAGGGLQKKEKDQYFQGEKKRITGAESAFLRARGKEIPRRGKGSASEKKKITIPKYSTSMKKSRP